MGTRERGRGGATGGVGSWGALLVCALVGCFRDEGPGQLCQGVSCVGPTVTSDSTSGPTSGSTGPRDSDDSASMGATGASETTGAPLDTGITMRLDSLRFIDPHLFLTDGGNNPVCTADITDAVNMVLGDDIAAYQFSLLVRFEEVGATEVRVIAADCDAPTEPDAMALCKPNDGTPAVILGVEEVAMGSCRDLESGVYPAVNLAMINDPTQPCVRTKRAAFSLSISGSVGALDLREAQFVAALDDAAAPTRLVDGVLYGFLPKVSAEDLMFDLPLIGTKTLWSVIDVPACVSVYPDLLPSVDTLKISGMDAPGVWVAINFTAERVVYQVP